MVRSLGAVIAGLLVMMVVVSSIQWMGYSWYPPVTAGPGADPLAMNPPMPTGALAMELLSLAIGSFLGAGTASTVSVRHKRGAAIAIGVVMLGLVAFKLVLFPHAVWVAVCALLVPVPFALLGWRVFR